MNFGKWVGLICLIITLIILWQVRQMLLLIFLAVVLATALNSLARLIQRIGFERRSVAVLLTLTIVILCMTLFVGLVIPPFIDQLRSLLQRLPIVFNQLARQVEDLITNPPAWLPELELELPELTTLTQQLQPLVQNLIQNFFEFFNSSIFLILKTLLVIALTIMMLGDPRSYREGFIKLFPSFYRRRTDEILTKCEVALGNWLGGIFINSVFVAAASGVGLSVLGIDFVLAHALLAGLLNFIPNIGPTLSVIFPLSIALLGPPWKMLAVVILYVIIQNVESYWVSPLVMAKQVSLLPAVTLSAQVFFTTFFGVLGLILALPLTVIAKTWIDEALICDILDRCDKKGRSPAIAVAGAPVVLEPYPGYPNTAAPGTYPNASTPYVYPAEVYLSSLWPVVTPPAPGPSESSNHPNKPQDQGPENLGQSEESPDSDPSQPQD